MHSGQGVLSRFPIRRNRRVRLPQPVFENPFWYNWFYLNRAVQIVELDVPGEQPVQLFNVHLEAFSQSNREQQARLLKDLVWREMHVKMTASSSLATSTPRPPKRRIKTASRMSPRPISRTTPRSPPCGPACRPLTCSCASKSLTAPLPFRRAPPPGSSITSSPVALGLAATAGSTLPLKGSSVTTCRCGSCSPVPPRRGQASARGAQGRPLRPDGSRRLRTPRRRQTKTTASRSSKATRGSMA